MMAVDADTKKYLEEVKKGKPRRFVMICKGVKILSMIVFKKGTVEKYKKQAKEEGKGQFYHGVVDGKGMDISFKLCRSDGYEKPPGKELILKDFLKSQADMKFKPAYELVDELPDVPEEDEDEQLKDSPTDGRKVAPEPAAGAPPTPEVDPAEAFKERLTALLPQIKQAAGTTAGDEAKLKASEAGVFARKHDFERAGALLDEAETLLKQPPPPPTETSPPPEVPPSPEVDPAEAFKERLTALLPQIKQAAGTTAGDEAKLKASEAGVFARKNDFERAGALLDEAETLLKQPPPPPTETSPPPNVPPAPEVDPAEAFKERLTAFLTQIKQAAGTTAGDEAKLKASEAGVFARKHDFERANALLDEVEALLKQPPPPPTKAPPTETRKKEDEEEEATPPTPPTEKAPEPTPPTETGKTEDDEEEATPPPPPTEAPITDDDDWDEGDEDDDFEDNLPLKLNEVLTLEHKWTDARDEAFQSFDALADSLRATADLDAIEVAAFLEEVMGDFPRDVEAALGTLRTAVEDADDAAFARAHSAAESAVKACLEYLAANKDDIDACEKNPFVPSVQIRKPLKAAIKDILASL
jgi:hypothetical protein